MDDARGIVGCIDETEKGRNFSLPINMTHE